VRLEKQVGEEVEVVVLRGGERVTVRYALPDRPRLGRLPAARRALLRAARSAVAGRLVRAAGDRCAIGLAPLRIR
jgi:hypothetical protein